MTVHCDVLHVGLESPSWRIGGLNRYLDELVHAQRELGLQVDVVWIDDKSTSNAHAVAPQLSWPRRLARFAKVIRRSSADVIDVHFAAHAYWALRSGALRRRPLVVHFQGPWALESAAAGESGWSLRLKGHLEGYVLRRADLVVTLSQAFRSVAIERYGVAPHRVDVVAPGVRVPIARDRDLVRATLAVAPDAVVILAVRRLVARMGLDQAVRMFAGVRRANERLVIVGDGPERSALEDLTRSLGVSDVVHLMGRLDDHALTEWYTAADVSIVPSVAHEGFGLVVYESLASGTPVVVADVGGLRDAARGCDAVRVVDVDAANWRRAIDELTGDAHVREIAAQFAATRSWREVAETHSALYDQVATGTRPGLVVVLDHTARLSGGELAIARLLSGLDRDRWRAHVILAESGPLCDELESRGISFEVLELGAATREVHRDELSDAVSLRTLWELVRYAVALRRRLARRRPDVVHTNSMKAHVYGVLSSLGARWSVVTHVRDRWAAPYLSERTARILRLFARFGPDELLANSRSTAAVTGVDASVLPSPVEEHFFLVPAPEEHADVRLGVIGRLAPWKGQDLAIRALAALPPTVSCELDLVGTSLFGESAYVDELHALANELGVANRVHFLGHVSDVAGALANIDIALLTSKSPEPFGNVVVEAMAAARAVVVPDRGGVTEFVSAERPSPTGFFYEMGDLASLVAVLARVVVDYDLRRWVGANARTAAASFRVENLAPLLENFYDELV